MDFGTVNRPLAKIAKHANFVEVASAVWQALQAVLAIVWQDDCVKTRLAIWRDKFGNLALQIWRFGHGLILSKTRSG